MSIADFRLSAQDLVPYGRGLQRPECVWVDADGAWASDARGGVCRVHAEREPDVLGAGIADPNGFSRRPDGSFVVAGLSDGRLYHISPDGHTRTLLDRLHGAPLGAVNYACADGPQRIWLSVMTRHLPWMPAMQSSKPDGYILRIDGDGTRAQIIADGLDLTNEVKVSPDGHHLYAVETLGGRIVRFPIRPDGSLGAKECVGPQSLGRGALPDGITFDGDGNVWVTVISQNALHVIDRDGAVHVVYSDMNSAAVEAMAFAVEQRTGTLDNLIACAMVQGPLRLPTSIAFGGPDGRTAFVGSVGLTHLATFRIPAELSVPRRCWK
ncbi:MAG TPA: SMP-30/gluconolactonase/LRE family protein [Steroidobacteraceae bacterium]|nr:SMP-30/gluconolactonase/LRE family protein [Steroidobacteraceae bacterium]